MTDHAGSRDQAGHPTVFAQDYKRIGHFVSHIAPHCENYITTWIVLVRFFLRRSASHTVARVTTRKIYCHYWAKKI